MNDTAERPPWVTEALTFAESHSLPEVVEELEDLVGARTALWRAALPDGRGFYLLKLHVPLVERQEVLTGNLLFGDFVRKCALEDLNANGDALALTGDLDDAYYLVASTTEADELALSVRERVGARLADLFFAEDDPERGIHGSPKEMFGFTKSDFEPYPVFAVPVFLAEDLYESMIKVIESKIKEDKLVAVDGNSGARRVTLQLRNIQAATAFFFGRTSGRSGDVQSPANFLFRLVDVYGVLDENEVRDALRLEKFDKASIKDAFDKATLDEEETRGLFRRLIQKLRGAKAEDADPAESWFLPFIRKDGKLLAASPEEYLDGILDGAFLGFSPLDVCCVVG